MGGQLRGGILGLPSFGWIWNLAVGLVDDQVMKELESRTPAAILDAIRAKFGKHDKMAMTYVDDMFAQLRDLTELVKEVVMLQKRRKEMGVSEEEFAVMGAIRKHTDMDDEDLIRLEYEVKDWYTYLTKKRKRPLYGRSAQTVLTSVQSFLSAKRCPLGKFKLRAPQRALKPVSVPNNAQLLQMVEYYGKSSERYSPLKMFVIASLAMSGLSVSDLVKVKWDDPDTSKYGTVRRQLKDDPLHGVIHIGGSRSKSQEAFDTFLGAFAMNLLREMPQDHSGAIVKLSVRQVHRIVSQAGRAAGLMGRVSPHVLRKKFSVTLKRLRDEDAKGLSEHWLGHSIDKTTRAYNILAETEDDVARQADYYKSFEKYLAPGGPEPPGPAQVTAVA